MKIEAEVFKVVRPCRSIFAICSLIFLLASFFCKYTLTDAAAPYSESEEYWRTFRYQNPFFVQDLILSSPLNDGSRLLILSEPPPLLFGKIEETLKEAFGDAYKGHDVYTQKIGFDGWVKDIVVSLSYSKDSEWRLEHDIATLHQKIFGTDYKAGYRLFDVKSWSLAVTLKRRNGAPPDLKISANSINEWLFEKPVGLVEITAGTVGFQSLSDKPVTLEEAFNSRGVGVFYSVDPGLVVLIIDRDRKLNEDKAYLRQFCLDTDAIIGAIAMTDDKSNKLAIIGRERDTALSEMPPLRVETILTLAATNEENLAQSYERNLPLADKTTDQELVKFVETGEENNSRDGASNVDWAPILLSHDLTHTEYGNLLNITDQILKSWSMSNIIKYGNFPYRAPFEFPFIQGVTKFLYEYLKYSPLTFNWNTAGFGSWVPFGKYNIFALHHTGALPVSYIIDNIDNVNFATAADSEAKFIEAEDRYWQFFAELRDPNLNRAAQYAALHVIFRKYGVRADREEPKPSLEEYEQRWKALELETRDALNTAIEHSDLSKLQLVASLKARKCLSIFKVNSLQNWLHNKDAILSEINTFRTSEHSLYDLAKLFVDSRSYLKALSDTYESKKTQFTIASNQRDNKIEEFNRDVTYCNSQNQRSSNLFLLNCNPTQINSRRTKIEQEDARLFQLQNEIDELEQEKRSLSNAINTIRDAVEVFGNCNKAWRGVVAEQQDFSEGFVKTPSIVVSVDSQDSTGGYGGHNIDGRSLKVIPDSSVSRGNFFYDRDIPDVLKINPDDTANAGAAARAFERLRQKYLKGSDSYKQIVDDRVRSALTQSVRAVEPVETALARNIPSVNKGRGLGSSGIDLDRNFVGGMRVELSAADVQWFNQMAETSAAQVVVQKVESGHRVLYKQKGTVVAIKTETQPAFQRAIEQAVDLASRDVPSKKGTVAMVSDGSLSQGDMQSLQLSANTRQTAVVASGGGGNRNFVDLKRVASGDNEPPNGGKPPNNSGGGDGFFSNGKGLFLRVFSRNRNYEPLLKRTDANWAAARVISQYIIARDNGGLAVIKLEVPFQKNPPGDFFNKMAVRIISVFRRKPEQKDLETLFDVSSKSCAQDTPDATVADRVINIQQEYKKRVGEDADLRIRLKQGSQDMYLIEIFVDDEPYEHA